MIKLKMDSLKKYLSNDRAIFAVEVRAILQDYLSRRINRNQLEFMIDLGLATKQEDISNQINIDFENGSVLLKS